MPAPTAAELARLRSSVEAWLTEPAVLNRSVRTPDNKGGYVNVLTQVWAGNVRRRPTSETRGAAVEAAVGDLQTATTYWVFTFPAGVNAQNDDEIVASGRTYQVVGDLDKTFEISRYVIAQERT